jgi:hypothetical protein
MLPAMWEPKSGAGSAIAPVSFPLVRAQGDRFNAIVRQSMECAGRKSCEQDARTGLVDSLPHIRSRVP